MLHVNRIYDADAPFNGNLSPFFAGEVYILASSKSMAQSHSGKLYKLVDPKRYYDEAFHLFIFLILFKRETEYTILFILQDHSQATN